ncbi:MAG: zinc carboxypeptidase, partial [Bacteroidota bacterium]
PGAIYKLKMDNTHPLAYGMSEYYYSLKTSGRNYHFLKNTWNVGYIGKRPTYVGFAGTNAQESMKETTVFGVQSMGRGSVVYMVDNPLFRGFWEQGKFLFSNALFMVK